MENNEIVKTTPVKATPLGGRVWFCAIFFGLIGQIAWMVENMFFATMAQDIFHNSARDDLSYIVTTLMVILSALAATTTTIFAGGLTDKAGKRKPFISIGYILWGITIMIFGFIPMKAEGSMIAVIAVLMVLFDCIMTFAGSTSNDAAFNAWIADNTDETNRGKLNGILQALPLIAVVIVFVVLSPFYKKSDVTNNLTFFLILGIIPIIAGIVAFFVLKDSNKLEKSSITFKETFYGFQPSVVKANKMLYVTLIALCLVGIAQQTFFSYLINFLINTLNLGDGFVIPMAVIIVGAGIVTGVIGFMLDKFGRKHFYIPLLIAAILGIFSFFLLQYMDGVLKTVVLYVGGILMMGGILSILGALTSNFQDKIPEKCEGRFQGVRMIFSVLIPMIIGPIISLIIGLDAMGMNGENFAPPYTLFVAASIVAVLAFIPLFFVRKEAKK